MAKSKINQKRVKDLLADYAAESKKLSRANNSKEKELSPINTEIKTKTDAISAEYADRIDSIEDKYSKRITSAEVALKNLEAEITNEMLKGFDGKRFEVARIEGLGAEINVITKKGQSEIDVNAWLKAVPVKDRTGSFKETIKVMVTKAKEFNGDLVKKLATRAEIQEWEITLNG